MSIWLAPAVVTSTRSCPGPGCGESCSASLRTSGPPCASTITARTCVVLPGASLWSQPDSTDKSAKSPCQPADRDRPGGDVPGSAPRDRRHGKTPGVKYGRLVAACAEGVSRNHG